PDGTKDEIKVPVTVGEQPQADQYDPEAGSIKKPYGEPTTEDEEKLPETGSQQTNNSALLGSLFAGIGSLFLIGRRRKYKKDNK
ncbi:LPXTG cell wall anchor domain-containing protein, partial [Staphylococcus delphini]|uniref:LPXTG cell wall anchor domain-containing protein n=1 Tax=Staphylococcus delphini TaxID=53344 RepID=UPI00374EAF89